MMTYEPHFDHGFELFTNFSDVFCSCSKKGEFGILLIDFYTTSNFCQATHGRKQTSKLNFKIFHNLVQWFLTAGPQTIFFSARLILIRNCKHCKVITFCKTYFTLDRFISVNWRISPSLITQNCF